MTNQLLRQLITHTITELVDMDAGFGKTKLVKLLYLMDVENYRRHRTTISGLEWRFYHYGPYAFEIDDALDELELDIPQDTFTTGLGHRAIVFQSCRELRPKLGEHVRSMAELRLVNRVIRDWGESDLNALLNHVYFYTEPMKEAKRGDFLDFSTIQRRSRHKTAARVPIPEDRLSEYRSRFGEAKAKRVRRSLDPAPRFDRVYQAGLTNMTEEEQYGVPPGTVNIPDEVKERLRELEDDRTSD